MRRHADSDFVRNIYIYIYRAVCFVRRMYNMMSFMRYINRTSLIILVKYLFAKYCREFYRYIRQIFIYPLNIALNYSEFLFIDFILMRAQK